MPQKLFIQDLKEGDEICTEFQITDIQDALTKNNSPYRRFKLGDKSGELSAVFWDSGNCTYSYKSGDICAVHCKIGQYQGKPQAVVQAVGPRESTQDGDFERCTKYDVVALWGTMIAYISMFKDHNIRVVAEDLFLMQGYQDRFKAVPAATGMHHAFKGGLIEHTSQMLECGDALLSLPFFSPLNRDICMFGIMFHDFGKLFEYSSDPGFAKTLQGVLVPHIPMMGALIFETCNKHGVPEIIRDHLMHVVLAHHGRMEWGSPVNMAFPEAAFVHYVDNLHGTIFGWLQKLEANPGQELVKHWGNTSFSLVGRSFNETLRVVNETSPGLPEMPPLAGGEGF